MCDSMLDGKVAFIAGGSPGINLAIAEGVGGAGAKIAPLSRSSAKIESAAQGLRDKGYEAAGFCADIRDFDAIDRALVSTGEHYGEIDVVPSGAAGSFVAPALQ